MTELDERRKLAFREIREEFNSLTEMSRAFGVSLPAVWKWKKFGIPESRLPYFRLKYPKLQAWKGLPRGF
jgi:hypothetical protein|nr:MAG TPA: excisionase [Caudoviricetes sp.]DAZ24375.1 MAG TPA: excisionase [Caudoviricetes sp.]